MYLLCIFYIDGLNIYHFFLATTFGMLSSSFLKCPVHRYLVTLWVTAHQNLLPLSKSNLVPIDQSFPMPLIPDPTLLGLW
jgi:hypothetical protein